MPWLSLVKGFNRLFFSSVVVYPPLRLVLILEEKEIRINCKTLPIMPCEPLSLDPGTRGLYLTQLYNHPNKGYRFVNHLLKNILERMGNNVIIDKVKLCPENVLDNCNLFMCFFFKAEGGRCRHVIKADALVVSLDHAWVVKQHFCIYKKG